MSRPQPPILEGLVFALIPAHRSLLDHSGDDRHPTFAGTGLSWIRQNGVYQIRAESTGRLVVPNDPTLEAVTDNSLFVAGNWADDPADRRVFSKRDAGGTQIDVRLTNTTRVRLYDGVDNRTAELGTWRGVRSWCAAMPSGQIATLYRNGIEHVAFTGTTTITPDDADISLLNYYTGANPCIYPVRSLLLYNRVITANENSDLAVWSDSLSSPELSPNRRYWDRGRRVPNGSAGGEIVAYDCGEIVAREIADRTGHGNHGSVSGSIAPEFTEVGRAARFDGVTGEIAVPDDATLDDYTDELTIEGLIRYDALTDTAPLLHREGAFSVHTDAAGLAYATFGTSGKAWAATSKSAGAVFVVGLWHHVALVYEDGVGVKIYVDGDLAVTDATFTGTVLKPAAGLYIGRYGAAGARLTGAVQFARLLNQAWTAGEVKARAARVAGIVLFNEDWSYPPTVVDATTGMLAGSGWRVEAGTWALGEDSDGPYAACVANGQLRYHGLPGADDWATAVFEERSGTPTLTKNADNLQIDALAGEQIGLVRLTLG
ncbi:MAG: LamG domain-containing protein [Candidatus Peribacteraceae bacterium]|nr:LamG domain-containing protein [Candidatus Peribacteraceae bacterium]